VGLMLVVRLQSVLRQDECSNAGNERDLHHVLG
jgi:hypothetical protein